MELKNKYRASRNKIIHQEYWLTCYGSYYSVYAFQNFDDEKAD